MDLASSNHIDNRNGNIPTDPRKDMPPTVQLKEERQRRPDSPSHLEKIPTEPRVD
jgi:hypothetical protein